MNNNSQQNFNKLPSKFSLYTEKFVGCLVLSLLDAFILEFLLFQILAYCGVTSPILNSNYASIFTIMMVLNWWFGLKELRESSRIIRAMNYNVNQILNMTAITVIKNSVQTISEAFQSAVNKSSDKDPIDENQDKNDLDK